MLIAWVPYQLYAHYFNLYMLSHHHPPKHGFVVLNYFHLSNALYGVCLSFIYYTKTGDAIIEWKLLLNKLFTKNKTNLLDNEKREIAVNMTTSNTLSNPLIHNNTRRISINDI